MEKQNHFLLLDAMRGVAAIAVVWFHLHFVVGYDCAGPLAVDLFFMLSGFVVAAAYDARLGHDLDFRSFGEKRAIRLYPMFLAGLVTALLVQQVLILRGAGMLSERQTFLSFALEAFWLPSPFNGGSGWTFPLDGPAWSLSLEVAVNLAFASLHPRLSNRVLIAIATISGAGFLWGVIHFGSANFGWSWQSLPLGLARVCYAFPLGVLMYRNRDLIPLVLARVPPIVPLGLLAALLLNRERTTLDIAFLLFGAPLLIAVGFRARISRNERLFRQLGEISYPLYALHGSIVLLVQGAAKILHLERWGLGVGIAATLGMAMAALPLAKWDERIRAGLTAYARRGAVGRPRRSLSR